jgi:hypothetical protein
MKRTHLYILDLIVDNLHQKKIVSNQLLLMKRTFELKGFDCHNSKI